jgi:biotin carboxyl carrier protein
MTKPIEFKDNKYTIRFVLRRAIEWYVFQKNSNPSYIFFLRHKKQNHQKIFYAIVGGLIQSISIHIDQKIIADQTTLCTIQAMKTDITIKSDCDGILDHIFIKPNQLINAGDPLFIITNSLMN